MKIKTSELTGVALDWIVTDLEKPEGAIVLTNPVRLFKAGKKPYEAQYSETISPTTNWEQAGPIIEREKIGLWWAAPFVDDFGEEYGDYWYAESAGGDHVSTGKTLLEAAMRCYVASKLGDEVEVPDGVI